MQMRTRWLIEIAFFVRSEIYLHVKYVWDFYDG